MKNLEIESASQIAQHRKIQEENLTLINDHLNLVNRVGEISKFMVYFKEKTPKLLAKLYFPELLGDEDSFMLVPLWQIVKYCQVYPQEGDYFVGTFVVGTRRITDKNQYLITLRLPRK